MRRLLLDTNVILDVVLDREPWIADARILWEANSGGSIQAHATASSLTDIFYVARRLVGHAKAWEGVRVCLDQLHVIAVGTAELAHAASLSGDDFEDNLQLACAITLSLDAVVSRDPDGFAGASLPIWSPAEAVRSLRG